MAAAPPPSAFAQVTHRVLFLCTGNSARSVLAESTLKKWGQGRYESFSAGSQPAGRVNPFAIAQLQREGFPLTRRPSPPWDGHPHPDAPHMYLSLDVCPRAAPQHATPGDPAEDEEPFLDPQWPHLAVTYELLLHLVSLDWIDLPLKKKVIDPSFVRGLLARSRLQRSACFRSLRRKSSSACWGRG